jgi:membrane-bound lytic murein transglycosylase D
LTGEKSQNIIGREGTLWVERAEDAVTASETSRPMRGRGCMAAVLWAALVAHAPALIAAPLPHDPRFDVPPQLQHQVDFWVSVFGIYSRRQVVIHDTERPDRVYRLLDFRDLAERGMSEVAIEITKERTVERAIEEVRGTLRRLHRLGPNSAALSEEEARIGRLFRHERDPKKFLNAAAQGRIRSQTGLRERFGEGIAIGHRYFPLMEDIFREEGLPVAITRLPLVESSFNLRAYSKVGASGIWQFMPFTARRFMNITDAVDERLDPIVSTRAAARYLRDNYERLGTWPLAITAYNHGPGGMARAVRELGTTDIGTIVLRYGGPSFKFASRNFYSEFLAALEVERDYLQYYGTLALVAPLDHDEVTLSHYVPIDSVVRCAGGDEQAFRELNPGLLPAVYKGRQRVPRHYTLRLPAGVGSRFERCYQTLPPAKKVASQKPAVVIHRVRRGQTLGQIARRYGTSVKEIQRRNRLRATHIIREGQRLEIPKG